MGRTRTRTGRRTAARKPASGITKTKIERVARRAKASLDSAAHDARLTLRRTVRKLKGTAQKLEEIFGEAKLPARRYVRQLERELVAALESVRMSVRATAREANSRLSTRR